MTFRGGYCESQGEMEHGLPPEICDLSAEWPRPGKQSKAESAAAEVGLWPRSAQHSDGRLGSGRVSLVGRVSSGVTDANVSDGTDY